MAEFVSAIVGIAVVGAKVGDSMYGLIDTIRDAPGEFLALSNEVTDFQVVLSRTIEVQQVEGVAIDIGRPACEWRAVLERAKSTLRDIERLVEKISKEKGGKSQEPQVNRFRWLQRKGTAKKLQERLRTQKASLCSLVTADLLKCSAQNGIIMSDIRLQMLSFSENQSLSIGKHDEMSARVERSQKLVEQTVAYTGASGDLTSRTSVYEALPPPSLGRILDAEEGRDRVFDKTNKALESPHGIANSHYDARIERKALGQNISATTHSDLQANCGPLSCGSLMVPRSLSLKCFEDCKCRCHYRSTIRSPRYLSKCIGDFFVACSNLPWCLSAFSQCNEQTCRRTKLSDAEFRYFFPSWISCTIASFNVNFKMRTLPLNVHLQTRQTIPYDSPILVCVQEGDIEGIKNLLCFGKASVDDVDPYGLGLLYYATYYCWRSSGEDVSTRTCKFLLEVGAHADWEDEIGNTPMETMIDDTLISTAMQRHDLNEFTSLAFEHITNIFGKSPHDALVDYIEDRNFSRIHEVLLGTERNFGTMEEYFASFGQHTLSPAIIDATDSRGRTALAWAVEYGWVDAVKALLRYGSNPNQTRLSVHGQSPLLHLVIAGPASQESDKRSLEVVRLLLEAGVDTNAVDHEGWTPLHVAASWNSYDVVKELVQCAGSSLNLSAMTDSKETALDLSLNGGHDAGVQRLLMGQGVSEEPLRNACGDQDVCDSSSSDGSEATTAGARIKTCEKSVQFHDAAECL